VPANEGGAAPTLEHLPAQEGLAIRVAPRRLGTPCNWKDPEPDLISMPRWGSVMGTGST
jgi:hypothetical protein